MEIKNFFRETFS